MSPAEKQLWQRLNRRASLLQPALAAALLRAFAILRDDMGDTALTRALETNSEEIFRTVLAAAVLDAALQPVRERLRRTLADAVPYFARSLPSPPKSVRTVSIGFDILNPRVIEAVRTLESRVMTGPEGQSSGECAPAYSRRTRGREEPDRDRTAHCARSWACPQSQELAVRNFEASLRGGPRVKCTPPRSIGSSVTSASMRR
jgi:hypothetical protein